MSKENSMAPAGASGGRKLWLDCLRGLAMLLVIWGHIDRSDSWFFLLTSPFKMPLFFAITGYLFNDRNGDVRVFARKILVSLVIPWMVLSLVWAKALYWLVLMKPGMIPGELYSLISGKDFWYMPCIILAEIFQFAIRRLCRVRWQRYAACAAAGAAGLLLHGVEAARFAMLDVALAAQLYMLFGLWFRDHEERIVRVCSWKILIAAAAAYAGLAAVSAVYFPGRAMDVHLNTYYSYPICGAMVFLSLLILFTAAQRLPRFPRWLVFVGQNTLVFYILHYYARSVYARGLRLIGLGGTGLLWQAAEFVFVCAAMTAVALIISRWFPFVAGKAADRGGEHPMIRRIKSLRWDCFSKYRDELYGIAIISVMLVHYSNDVTAASEAPRLMKRLAAAYRLGIGGLGVDVFLFLSGIGLFYSMRRDSRVLPYLRRRFDRSVVPYLVYGLVYWVIYDLILKGTGFPRFLLDYSLLAFWVSPTHQFWYLPVYYLLCLLYPLVWFAVLREENPAARRVKEAVLTAASMAALIAVALLAPGWYANTEIGLCRFLVFLAGCMAGRLAYEKKPIKHPLLLIAAGLGLRVAAMLAKWKLGSPYVLSAALPVNRWIISCYALALALICVLLLDAVRADWLHRFLRWMGGYSLELYMTHVSVRFIVHALGVKTWQPWAHVLLVWVPAVLLSIGLRRLIGCFRRRSA
ncbi:MAG: acyltransferase [Firmicutes bacterium]|nr:acyltransferase [Bacillota bacterium]